LKTSDFAYNLPPRLIAQQPIEYRDKSRLLVIDRKKGKPEHRHFHEIGEFLHPGDCLVLNNSRVMPARLTGKKETGGTCEVLLLRDIRDGKWECICRPSRRLPPGSRVIFGGGKLSGIIGKHLAGGKREIVFNCGEGNKALLGQLGEIPLPPYITHPTGDPERYQTVYSKHIGSAAAPTAGLHFTPELLEKLTSKGIRLAEVTLHVGLGTFRPVKSEEIENHVMHSEWYEIPICTAQTINRVRKERGRVIAVGTTSVRTLEAAFQNGVLNPGPGETEIFITPGYNFNVIDAIITNFHLPESSLLMLVSAFCTRERILEAYREAIEEEYRFFSFGDAMLIL